MRRNQASKHKALAHFDFSSKESKGPWETEKLQLEVASFKTIIGLFQNLPKYKLYEITQTRLTYALLK